MITLGTIHFYSFIYPTNRVVFIPTEPREIMFVSVQRLGYGLDDRGSRARFPAGAGNFSLHHRVQTGSGAHPAFYPIGTRGSFPGSKAARV
jgi:hypothetical protein